ncbi:hypothetical protein [Stieleria varia]|uniref:Carboxypeptidase regulatory-like domain-containing protein n=1 Tax=Stieleria varia TaxID=2528005 RepID=A0A5C6AH47_9BACT|nr:hypothetical protein [Stieleria varia]TWT98391.1 hypothetical protein Pla52n_49040 [Stieleria varia]
MRPFTLLYLFAGLACIAGCTQKAVPAVTASGTVHVDGAPLSGAVITFEPLHGTTGPNASVPVFAGRFDVTTEAGLHGGRYLVRISLIPPEIRKTLPAEQSATLPPEDAVIDPEFDANSQLSCELKLNQTNPLAFDVEFL